MLFSKVVSAGIRKTPFFVSVVRLIFAASQNRDFRGGLHSVDSGQTTANGNRLAYWICRVSTDDQNLDQQRAALKAAGCKRIYEEKASGPKRDRPQLALMFDHLRADDPVTETRLDRLARSTRDLLDIAERIEEAGTSLRSLAETWAEATSPAGCMVLTVFAGIAEFERSLIHERTSTGRAATKAKGVRFGRPPALSPDQLDLAQRLRSEGRKPRQIAATLNVHVATLYRALADTPAGS